MTERAHNGRRSVSQPVATSEECSWSVCGCVSQGLRGGSPTMLVPRTAALLDARADAQSLDSPLDRHLQCGVALIVSHSHSIYVRTNRTGRLPGRKRGNDAGRAKAIPPPFNAAIISLQTASPSKPAKFFYLFDIVPSSDLFTTSPVPPSALSGTLTRPASHSLSHLSSNNAPHANRRILLLGATPL